MIPLAARLAEKRRDYPVPPVEYSDDLQRSIREPEDLANPMYMSPTTIYTPHGDQQGDEAH